MPASNPTALDLAASIDRVLRRNIQFPLRNVVFADSPVSASILNRAIMADATAGAIAVSLPDATLVQGMSFEVKKTDASGNTVTVMSSVGGQTIDGAASAILATFNDFITVESDGANYKIVSTNQAAAPPSATPKAATYVVHPTPGLGDFTTIEAALAATPAAGAYILAREFTFTPPAGGYIAPNAPVVLRGCGPATKIDQGAAADAAFNFGFAHKFVLEDLHITGNAANVNRRVVSISTNAEVHLNRVTGDNLRKVWEVTGGGPASVHEHECTFTLFDDPGSLWVDGNGSVVVTAEDTTCTGPNNRGGIAGTPRVNLTNCTLSGTNGFLVQSESVIQGCKISGTAGENLDLGQQAKVVASIIEAMIVRCLGSSVKITACDLLGSAAQARVLDILGATGPKVVGSTFRGCSSELVRVQGGSLDSEFLGNDFIDDATCLRAIDVQAAAFRILVDGNDFRFFDTEAVRIATANCIVTNNVGCRVVEIGTANQNRYANNTGFDPSGIIGAASIIEDNNVLSPVGVDITLDQFMRTVPVDASGAARTITLPTAASARFRKYTIKKVDSSPNTVTIDADGAETIDGALTQVLTSQWQGITVQSDGTTWYRTAEAVATQFDPRDVFRFSMFHNVGVTGGG